MGDRHPIHQDQLGLRPSKLIAIGVKSMARALTAGPLDHPKLDHFDRASIESCIDKWASDATESAKYKRLVDTICQGYCYPPISVFKAAFGVPIYPRTVLLGNANKSDMFRHGTGSLPEALHAAFVDLGGQLQLGCAVSGFDGRTLTSSAGAHTGDVFIFAQNADHQLMRDLVPRSKPPIRYTRFVTAVVRLREVYQPDTPDWGAIFFAPDETEQPIVLSMIDLQRLYASAALHRHYTVNIRLPDDVQVDDRLIIDAVSRVLPAAHGAVDVVTFELWPQTMPVSNERFVEAVRALQGLGGCYFAGDYLGCPSMEVAVTTGLTVARQVQEDHSSASAR